MELRTHQIETKYKKKQKRYANFTCVQLYELSIAQLKAGVAFHVRGTGLQVKWSVYKRITRTFYLNLSTCHAIKKMSHMVCRSIRQPYAT